MSGENVITVKNLKTYFYSNNRCNKAVNGVSFDIRILFLTVFKGFVNKNAY